MLGIRVRRLTHAEAHALLRERSWWRLIVDLIYGALWLTLPFTFGRH